jgi:hypothetical protein
MLLIAGAAHSQTPADSDQTEEHSIIFEIAWAGDWSQSEGMRAKGGTFAIEVEPIEG